MLFPRLLTSCRNSSNHFSTLPTTSGLLSALLNDLHLYSHLLGSPQLSFHLSLFSSQLLSTRVDSPHLSSTGPIFLSPVEVTQVQTFFFSAVDLLFHSVDQVAFGLFQTNLTFGATIRLRLSHQSLRHNHCCNFHLSYHWILDCHLWVQRSSTLQPQHVFPRARRAVTAQTELPNTEVT